MPTGLSASQWVLLFTFKKNNTIDFNVSQFKKKEAESQKFHFQTQQSISLNLQINKLNFRTYHHNRHFH